jgi:hypothetical protein
LLGLGTCECRGVKNDDFSKFGDLGGDFYKETYEPKLFGMHIRSVLRGWNAKNASIDLKMSMLPLCRVGNVYVHRVNRVVFSMFGGLGGDFCKDTYEAKLFGMHIGSVLSGLYAGNVNTDAKISIVGFGDVYV